MGVDGAQFLQGTGGTRALKAAGGDMKESYILGRSAPSQRSPIAESAAGGVHAQWARPPPRGGVTCLSSTSCTFAESDDHHNVVH